MKHALNITFIILLMFTTLCQSLKAQDNSNNLSYNDVGLQFQIDENFKLESFSGSTISYKIQRNEKRAYRFGLGIETLSSSGTNLSGVSSLDNTELDLNVDLNLKLLNYVNPGDEIKLFYGIGPSLSAGYKKSDEENEDSIKIEATTSQTKASAVGLVGVEWFFHDSMSLHAEYQSSFDVTWHNEEINTENLQTGEESTADFDDTSYRFGGNGVQFGLTIYY